MLRNRLLHDRPIVVRSTDWCDCTIRWSVRSAAWSAQHNQLIV